MLAVRIDGTLRMYYESHSFVAPWVTPETALLLRGIVESPRM
ncbi:MAG: hypothetical protein QGH66_05165 [Dehalococcoidia bacterium]|nr:hypothetical protein [Dehalococcoidia bacterium]MDP7241006.1 hypothetical protein [Dehalococcoidia bacterium]